MPEVDAVVGADASRHSRRWMTGSRPGRGGSALASGPSGALVGGPASRAPVESGEGRGSPAPKLPRARRCTGKACPAAVLLRILPAGGRLHDHRRLGVLGPPRLVDGQQLALGLERPPRGRPRHAPSSLRDKTFPKPMAAATGGVDRSPGPGPAGPRPGARTCVDAEGVEAHGLGHGERADGGPPQVGAGGHPRRGARRGRRPGCGRRCPTSTPPRASETGPPPWGSGSASSGGRGDMEAAHRDRARRALHDQALGGPARAGAGPPTLRADTMGGTWAMAPVSRRAAASASARVTCPMSQRPVTSPEASRVEVATPSTTCPGRTWASR